MTRKSIRFESFTLDLERLCLRGPSGEVELRRKSFEVVRYLLEHGGKVVTKEELIKAVWPGVTVSDESLAQCISEVRRAIRDDSQRIIKTVPRRGYLLDVPISADNDTVPATPTPGSARIRGFAATSATGPPSLFSPSRPWAAMPNSRASPTG